MASLQWRESAGGTYPYIVSRQNGRQKWLSLSRYRNSITGQDGYITTKKEAEVWFRHWRKRGCGQLNVCSGGPGLISFIREYERYSQIRHSPENHKRNVAKCAWLAKWLTARGISRLDEITMETAEDVYRARVAIGNSTTTAIRYAELLRAITSRAAQVRKLPQNPLAKMTRFRNDDRGEPRCLTDKEVRIVLSKFPTPDREFAMLCIFAGLRGSEAAYLARADVDGKYIHVRAHPDIGHRLKTEASKRSIPMAKRLKAPLKALRPRGRFIFDNGNDQPARTPNAWYQRIVHLYARHGIKARTPNEKLNVHTLRHTFGTTLVSQGTPLPAVKDLMGHTRIETTMQYVHMARRDHQDGIKRLDDYFSAL